ncbi:glycosyltransferase [Halolamina litorea]|uniref:Glycosyltransferase n=1 Tax=Halolamina litorea TaxID=1515593 RepID=A0ABD6BTN8_9EURY|nr:glycosyltransferase [Halolamina litorea]
MESVAAFTDTYLPTVNGVTYTVQSWRDCWRERGGRMDVVYPDAPDRAPEPGEYPVRSLPLPIYAGYRLGIPKIPDAVADADLVHAHTPFALGLAGLRLARAEDVPFVATYHTPTSEYASYLSSWAPVRRRTAALSRRYESWFLGQADAVIVPSASTGAYVTDELGVDDPQVVPNGVDTDRFRPVEDTGFRERHGLPENRTLVGYTGRHGHEKSLPEIIDACDRLDREVTVVFGGDGPARAELEAAAAEREIDARFLGFLDREELPSFYATLDAFLFPSPVETQGLVALEAFACGTPVVGVDSGALSDTVDDGETGYHFEQGDTAGFAAAIERTLGERERLRENCLTRREAISVEGAVDRLSEIYAAVRE